MQDNVVDLVARMPELDKQGKLTGPTWAEAIPIYDAILRGGRARIDELVCLIGELDDGVDYKARYTLHGIAVYLGRPEKNAQRALFCEALAGALGGNLPKSVQGFLVRQLQVVGDKQVAPALGTLLLDADLHEYAAQALLAIRDGAVEQFRKALPLAEGKPRLTILQALGVLRDGPSLDALKKAALDGETRLIAVWALANIGDAGSIDVVLKAADAKDVHERNKSVSAALLLAERLIAAGRKPDAAKIYTHLRDTRTDASEKYVRDAAEKALAGG